MDFKPKIRSIVDSLVKRPAILHANQPARFMSLIASKRWDRASNRQRDSTNHVKNAINPLKISAGPCHKLRQPAKNGGDED